MSRFDKVVKNNLCMGCGLCESLGRDSGYKVTLKNNGFYSIDLPAPALRDKDLEAQMARCCPSVSIKGAGDGNIWGHNLGIYNAYSTDTEIRHRASSGGFVTAACTYLLEKGLADGILHVGLADGSPIINELKVSSDRDEILANCSSRYAPAPMFVNLKQILDSNLKKYVFVGKSCDILCINNFLDTYPSYKDRFLCTISIFCAGMPSYNASKKIAESFGNNLRICRYQYRGNGWPGSFTVSYEDGSDNKKCYEDAWMNYLGKDIHFRCKICPDSVGTIADFSVGDAWILENGKIVFKDRPGISCVIVRSAEAKNIFDSMITAGCIKADVIPENRLDKIQPNHVRKRLSSGYKIAVVKYMAPGVIQTRSLSLFRLCLQYNILRGVKEALGAKSRFKKWRDK